MSHVMYASYVHVYMGYPLNDSYHIIYTFILLFLNSTDFDHFLMTFDDFDDFDDSDD